MYLFDSSQTTNTFGMEAINYQISSSLGKNLTTLFQTVIDFKNNLVYKNVTNTEEAQRAYRINAVYDFFKKQICPKFTQLVNKETGLTIKSMMIFGKEENGVSGMFAVDLSFNDWRASIEMQNRITGNENIYGHGPKQAVEDLKRMAENINLKTGKITKPYYGKDKKIQVNIYFDVNAAFLVGDFFPARFATPLTAGEVAAIMMHEIGHALTIVEHSADMFVTYQRASLSIQQLRNEKDLKGAVALISTDLLPALKEMKSLAKETGSSAGTIDKICNTLIAGFTGLRELTETSEPDSESWIYSMGSFTVNVMVLAIALLANAFMNLCFFMAGGFLITEIARVSYINANEHDEKAGDNRSNFNNTFLIERWADEYVSRHGYGAELASGLNKITEYFKYGSLGTITSHRVRKSTVFNFLCIIYCGMIDKMMPISYLDPHGYENQYSRLARVLQNTYGFFKDEAVPGVIVDQWVRSVESIKIQMKNAKTMSDTEFGKAFYNTLRNLTSPVRWFQLIANGNLDRDTEIIANQLDDMKNNPFYFIAAKMKRQ